MRALPQMLLMLLAVKAGGAEPLELPSQTLILPASVNSLRFVDIDGDGRCDLLAMEPAEKLLLNYHQRPEGFANAPDQTIPLPPQTIWAAPCDLDAHAGLELLVCTTTGLVYARQNAGRFESEWHTLIEASQVFTNTDFPFLTSLTTNKDSKADFIPVISAGQAVVYYRSNAYEWNPGAPLPLEANRTSWQVGRLGEEWTMGAHPAHSLRVWESIRAKPEPEQDTEPENDTIRKIREDMKQTATASPPAIVRVDINGDGREDLVLWQCSGTMAFKTDLYIFLRGADQKLPERPTQILHCRGYPIPMGPGHQWSPVHDLNGEGVCELVLLELRTTVTSASGLVEALLERGLDWSLTVRSFRRGAFASSPDASVPVTMLLPAEVLNGWTICLQRDFNGDGRPDLLVRRTDTRWHIYLSTTDGHWFAPQPALTFDAPAQGYMEIKDLNGDGRSDIIWHQPEEHRFTIFMTPPSAAKDRSP